MVACHSSTLALFKGTRFAKNKVASLLYCAVDWSSLHAKSGARGSVVFKALRYKPAGRGFDSRWCH